MGQRLTIRFPRHGIDLYECHRYPLPRLFHVGLYLRRSKRQMLRPSCRWAQIASGAKAQAGCLSFGSQRAVGGGSGRWSAQVRSWWCLGELPAVELRCVFGLAQMGQPKMLCVRHASSLKPAVACDGSRCKRSSGLPVLWQSAHGEWKLMHVAREGSFVMVSSMSSQREAFGVLLQWPCGRRA